MVSIDGFAASCRDCRICVNDTKHDVIVLFLCFAPERTESILSMVVMHGSLTASLPLILAPAATGVALFHFYALFGLVLVVIILGIAWANGGRLGRTKPPEKSSDEMEEDSWNRIYAGLLVTGASVLIYRTVSMVANGYLAILVPWVAGSILLELFLDTVCFLTAIPWLISGEHRRASVPLQIGALCTVTHAARVFVYVLGRLDTQWKDFDIRPEQRAVHNSQRNRSQVYFASTVTILSLMAVATIRRRRAHAFGRKLD